MKRRTRVVAATLIALGAIGLLLAPLPRQFVLATRIVTIATIERPDTVVFDFVTTPAHWPVWHSSSLAVSGATDHSLVTGEQVTEEFRVAGRRGRAVWTVAERDRPRRWVIEGTIDGRPAGTVTYALTPAEHGTRFERDFTYRAPSLWFMTLNELFLRARIRSESDKAVSQLKRVLEAAPLTPIAPVRAE
jgi:Polyketide cyclase / dehydrase and lipid transport